MKYLYLSLVVVSITLACETAKEMIEETTSSSEFKYETIDIAYMDTSVRPQDDFFMYANGTWVKENPVPSTESVWGSFNELDQANKKKLTVILEEAMKSNAERGSMNQILGDYYASYINMDLRNERGLSPIEPMLARIDKIYSKDQIVGEVSTLHRQGVGTLFRFGIGQDQKNVDKNVIYLSQGGIGLPNKDYYLKEEKKDIREQYVGHMTDMFALTGIEGEQTELMAKQVMEFETKIAKYMMSPAERRDPDKTYNKYSRPDIIRLFEAFNFDSYLNASGVSSFDSLIVGQPDHVINIVRLINDTDLDDWKAYLKWCVINNYAPHLDDNFIKAHFKFYGVVLRGKKEMKPINERAINEITGSRFSELLGKAFVEKYYSEESQQRVNKMVDDLLAVFEERIKSLDWMSDDTKKEALNKLQSIGRKLGYPSKWEDFSDLKFTREDYFDNLMMTERFAYQKNIEKLDEPVDREKWGMPAHLVNAYYHPLLNEIAFPAGIMQPPFFSDKYEDAVNYGRMGMVIGHEFTHGFDDKGSKYAADGSLSNWWTEEDRKLFEGRTKILGNTFEGFCPVEGHCVNPELTMGENIADLGGLTLAYYAYQRTDEYKSGVSRHGFTPSQRFFLAYAQLWKINFTEAELKNRLANDPHSPGMFRVNGPLMNCPEFFKTFNIQEDDPMRNEEGKVARIW